MFFPRASCESTASRSLFSLGSSTVRLPLPRIIIPSSRGLMIIKTVQPSTLQPRAKDIFDAAHHRLVLMGDQGAGIACLLGPAGTADPMGVSICCIRHVIIDDMRDP